MNFLQILRSKTSTDWTETDGPDSGHGIDRYFADNEGNEAYANTDQGYSTLSMNGAVIAAE